MIEFVRHWVPRMLDLTGLCRKRVGTRVVGSACADDCRIRAGMEDAQTRYGSGGDRRIEAKLVVWTQAIKAATLSIVCTPGGLLSGRRYCDRPSLSTMDFSSGRFGPDVEFET
jgi:hypothetical protein